MITKKKCMLYEIGHDVHWLMLTDVKHIKKSVLFAQGSFVRSLMLPIRTNSGFKLIHLVNIYILGVQLRFRRFPIDGFSGKW